MGFSARGAYDRSGIKHNLLAKCAMASLRYHDRHDGVAKFEPVRNAASNLGDDPAASIGRFPFASHVGFYHPSLGKASINWA
jgi:hypothetical protein